MTNKKILALAPNAWHGPWMNRQQLLSRLAKTYPILYSTGALSVWDRTKPEWTAAPWLPEFQASDGVIIDVPGRLPPRWPRQASLDSAVLRFTVRRWLRRLFLDSTDTPVLYLFHPKYACYVKHFPAHRLVYHAYDSYEQTPGWCAELHRSQMQLLLEADLIVASSAVIAGRLQDLCDRSVILIPNGVDFEIFSNKPSHTPDDIASIPRPRLGYVGRVNRKIDIRLLDQIASDNPSSSVVIVGPVTSLDNETTTALASLRNRPNAYFLGNKPHQDLPAYMHCLDVGLLPYRISDDVWTEGIYPLKLHEYLAAGLPVIASDIPSLREFADVLTIAPSSSGEWTKSILNTLENNSPEKQILRVATARDNDWNTRAAALTGCLDKLT